MKTMKRFLTSLIDDDVRFRVMIVLIILVGLTFGCNKSTLAPGGAYSGVTVVTNSVTGIVGGITNAAPDLPLFEADLSYQLAYTSIDAAFTTEKNNRTLLWSLSPNIKHTLDRIRPVAWQANVDYLTARDAYIANPIPPNLTSAQAALARLQAAVTAALAAMPQNTITNK